MPSAQGLAVMPANDALERAREIVRGWEDPFTSNADRVNEIALALTAYAADHLAVIEAMRGALRVALNLPAMESDAIRRLQIDLNDPVAREAATAADKTRRQVEAALALTPDTLRAQAANNQVACVNCKRPVQVTAMNAIRCNACIGAQAAAERAVIEAAMEWNRIARNNGTLAEVLTARGALEVTLGVLWELRNPRASLTATQPEVQP